MKRRIAALALAPLLATAACDAGGDVDFGGEELGEIRFAVPSSSGAARMALTDDYVFFALSDSLLAVARAEMEGDSTSSDGIGGTIAGAVRGGVTRALSFRARYAVSEIRDIRWEDDRMVFDFVDPDRTLGSNFRIDGAPMEEVFDQAAVEAFAAEFRKLKARRGER